MNRKKPNILLTCLAIVGLCMSMCLAPMGCTATTTIQNGQTNTVSSVDWQKTARVVTDVGRSLAPVAIQKCPQCVPWFKDAILVLNIAIQKGQYDPEQLRQAVITAGVNEIRGPEAEAALQALFSIYQIYYGDVVTQKLDQQKWVLPVLTAIRDVLQAAVDASPVAAVETMPKAEAAAMGKALFEKGVRYGVLAYINNPEEDDIPTLTKKAELALKIEVYQ